MTSADREQIMPLLPEGHFTSSKATQEDLVEQEASASSAAALSEEDPVKLGGVAHSSLGPNEKDYSEANSEQHQPAEPAADVSMGRTESPHGAHNEGVAACLSRICGSERALQKADSSEHLQKARLFICCSKCCSNTVLAAYLMRLLSCSSFMKPSNATNVSCFLESNIKLPLPGEGTNGISELATPIAANTSSTIEDLEPGADTGKKHAFRRKSIAASSTFKRHVTCTATSCCIVTLANGMAAKFLTPRCLRRKRTKFPCCHNREKCFRQALDGARVGTDHRMRWCH